MALPKAQLDQLLAAKEYKKWPLAKLISLFESSLPDKQALRHQIISYIEREASLFDKRAKILGFTGTPGAGKSSLIAELCCCILQEDPSLSIAVLAVDPSSQVSGGSILGDRTRMRNSHQFKNLFFRSQASNLELGGVAQSTFQATRILRYFFDFIFIETVGIGQNEIDIQHLSDHTYLVTQPLAGDQIQFMKCGIMEIPDSFIVNKCDEEKLARSSYFMLRAALKQARIVELEDKDDYHQSAKDNIFLTSAHTGKGIEALANSVINTEPRNNWHYSEWFYLNKWIHENYGRFGTDLLNKTSQEANLRDDTSLTYERKLDFANKAIHRFILPQKT